jgi:hypothetical protein
VSRGGELRMWRRLEPRARCGVGAFAPAPTAHVIASR